MRGIYIYISEYTVYQNYLMLLFHILSFLLLLSSFFVPYSCFFQFFFQSNRLRHMLCCTCTFKVCWRLSSLTRLFFHLTNHITYFIGECGVLQNCNNTVGSRPNLHVKCTQYTVFGNILNIKLDLKWTDIIYFLQRPKSNPHVNAVVLFCVIRLLGGSDGSDDMFAEQTLN